jgi:GTP-binding protein Era
LRSGFVALAGRPNAGKSTLLNALLGQKLSIVSPKPQTTRHKLLGILNGPGHQVCILDTPGWLDRYEDKLQKSLLLAARTAVREDADLVLLVAEPSPPGAQDRAWAESLLGLGKPLWAVVNKADLGPAKAREAAAGYEGLGVERAFAVSALKGEGVRELAAAVVSRLPEGPAYYGPDQLSDRWERYFASELIREAVFDLYFAEVPHATAVVIEDFRETPGERDLIRAVLYAERDGQKGILLGPKGRAIAQLREESLRRIEDFLGRPAELELWVKVRKDWRKDPKSLREFGY